MSGPLHCTAPDVLPNTNGRCTWCGRPMPKRPREFPSREWMANPRRSGTDPVAYLGDAREEEQ